MDIWFTVTDLSLLATGANTVSPRYETNTLYSPAFKPVNVVSASVLVNVISLGLSSTSIITLPEGIPDALPITLTCTVTLSPKLTEGSTVTFNIVPTMYTLNVELLSTLL